MGTGIAPESVVADGAAGGAGPARGFIHVALGCVPAEFPLDSYPKGPQISLLAKIVAVANVYDNLRNPTTRPGR